MSAALQGRVAVVTGASKGLGQQMAESLAVAGASVALVARSGDLLNSVAAGIRDAGGRAETIVADVSDEAAVADVAAQVKDMRMSGTPLKAAALRDLQSTPPWPGLQAVADAAFRARRAVSADLGSL